MTAARTGETLGALWSEFDLVAATWTIPAGRMKAGSLHRVPFADRCIDILQELRAPHPDSRHLCPGRKPGKPLSNMCFEMAMRRLDRTETPHGFRSSFRHWAAEQSSFSHEVIEAALAHTIKSKTGSIYARKTQV